MNFPHKTDSSMEMPRASGRGVTAVLGPTNTGKTHLAIERMVAHPTGLIGLPLRLLAREVYGRVADKVGAANVALITGEEKINAASKTRFQVCTVEAMPEDTTADFVAIDEVQLAADLERGHVFTDRILNLRGRHETMLLGAETIAGALRDLLPGIDIVTRPRMSVLEYSGQKKITRLPQRSAIVAFSSDQVYAIAELIRRQRGGAAVVMGSLSPRTRNAQVGLYQSGDVDFLVATDAIGMGLNLDVDHVAFAQDRKFDGLTHRRLHPAEMGQIAGRAGRHIRNGTFGVTGNVRPFEDELVQRLETHEFDPVKVLIWRNRQLDFSSLEDLHQTLELPSAHPRMMKSFPASDLTALSTLSREEEIAALCSAPERVRLLWEVCKIPDYRRISPGEHAELLRNIFLDLARRNQIDETWFSAQVERTDRTEGDIDALSTRIAHVRTWTYLSNRAEWLHNSAYWQEKTRNIEDRLSDALHDSLTRRFIDRRTSVLMKRLRENAMLEAEIAANGDVTVEGHHVGSLQGFRFTPDRSATGPEAKAANAAAMKALAIEFTRKAERLHAASNADFALTNDATIRWSGEPVAKVVAGNEPLKPRIVILADEQLTGQPQEMVVHRLERWLNNHIVTLLKPLADIVADNELTGTARGVGFRLVEQYGTVTRSEIASEVHQLDQDARSLLRRHGVRFGAYHIFLPALLKPAPMALTALLWAINKDRLDAEGVTEIPALAAAGRTSFPADGNIDEEVYRVCGFRVLVQKAVRVDILERLADQIRPALAWKPGSETPAPEGAVDGRSFVVTPGMLSILGATHDDMVEVLKGLGYRCEPKKPEEIEALQSQNGAVRPAVSGGANGAAEPQSAGATDPSTANGSEPGSSGAGSGDNPPGVTTPEQPGTGDDSGSETDEVLEPTTAEPAEALEEEKIVMLWRSGRGERRQRPARADAGEQGRGRHEKKGGKKPPRRARKGNAPAAPHAGRGPKPVRERQPDPDSPFAKLASLKAELENDRN